MFGGEGSYEDDIRRLKEREKARRVRETIENEDGLNVDTDRMRDAVDYASKGGVRIKAKSKDGLPYDSQRDKLIVELDEPEKFFEAQAHAAMKAFSSDE